MINTIQTIDTSNLVNKADCNTKIDEIGEIEKLEKTCKVDGIF